MKEKTLEVRAGNTLPRLLEDNEWNMKGKVVPYDHPFGKMIVSAESIVIVEEENTVLVIKTVIMSLETSVRCILLTSIEEWLTKKRAGSTTASRGVMLHDLLTPKQC